MLREEDSPIRPALGRVRRAHGSQVAAIYLLNEARSVRHYAAIGLAGGAAPMFSATEPKGEFGAALAAEKDSAPQRHPPQTRFTFAIASGDFRRPRC